MEVNTAPALVVHIDDFLAKVGPEFDPTFVKFNVGTDDLDELLQFTTEKNDLSPLVDAGLKPLLRNKLFRAILEEKAERANREKMVVRSNLEPADIQLASPTATPSTASMYETGDNEDTSSTMIASTYSASGAGQVPTLSQEGSMLETSPDLLPASLDLGTALVSSGALVTEESQSPDSGFDLAAFPPLGAPGDSRSVPQAKHIVISPEMEKAWAYRADDRETRRAARTEAGAARERAERMQQAAQQAARRTPQRILQSTLLAQAQASQPASRMAGYGRQFGLSSAYQSNYTVGSFGCPRSCRICYPTG